MKIIRAEHLGMCFGVRDAIALAVETAKREPLTVLGDLVHNETVLAELRAKGIQFKQQSAKVGTQTVMVTAHGASERAMNETRQRGLNVLEATCPLVHVAHRSLKKLVGEGFHPVVIGKRDHVEVRGMTEDLDEFDVVLCEMDVANLCGREKFGIISQTTQPIEKVRELVQMISERFPKSEARFVDTVCQPTKQRQSAAIELAQKCDVVVVIGGAHSNNTHELVKTCSQFCASVHHVQTADDLQSKWFCADDIVGVTAGTSTPDEVIDTIEKKLDSISVNLNKPNNPKEEMFMQTWLEYFERNRASRPPVPWENGVDVEPHLRAPLIRSLQKFQLGESGEGRNLKRHAKETGDTAYATAIDLFIKEEQEHSRLMAKILRGLNAPLIEKHWGDRCFVFLRHLFGLHQELMVLLLPEMIAKRYFHALHDGTRDPVLRAVFAQIARDEDGHPAFHIEYLRRAFEKMSFTRKIFTLVIWRIAFRATCLVVMLDHRAVLRAVGLKPQEFWRDCGEIFDEVAAGIFSPACVLAPVTIVRPI
jgi:4-hydroxy-3-methylbut-2-en-1-yl diphosphate reductase